MKKSTLAITAFLGLCAGVGLTAGLASAARADPYRVVTTTTYYQPPVMAVNPNNCSGAWRDCGNSQDGSNHAGYGSYYAPMQYGYVVPPAPSRVIIYNGQ